MDATDVLAECRKRKGYHVSDDGQRFADYSSDLNKHTEAVFAANGAQTITVAVAGFKLLITYFGSTLVAIHPRAMSAGRGEYVIWPGYDGASDSWVADGYWSDHCARAKTGAAVDIAFAAWAGSGGNLEAFYRALGKRGFCAICGASLTDELSMSRGIGPECYSHIGVGRQALHDVKAVQAAGHDGRLQPYAIA